MRRIFYSVLILTSFLFTAPAQQVDWKTQVKNRPISTGTAAPSSSACDAASELNTYYLQTGDPASVVTQMWSCVQTGASSYSWQPISHKYGTTAPATCVTGQVFFDTDAAVGSNWYGCTSTNTWTLLSGGGGGGATTTYTGTVDLASMYDGTCAEGTFSASGLTTGTTLAVAAPATFPSGVLLMAFASASNVATVRACNLSGATVDPASGTYGVTNIGSIGYLSGSATINFTTIPDGSCGTNTLTVTGAATGDELSPGWPAALETGLLGHMIVSAANTVTIYLCNWSGASIDPASGTFSTVIVK